MNKLDVSLPLDPLTAGHPGDFSLDNLGAIGSELARWPIEALRGADPIMGLAVLMIVALLAGEAVHRVTRLPRALGAMLVGALASPLALSLVVKSELDPWKPLLDLAVGLLVFELGSRIRPRWLVDNPWLAVKCLAEALATGLAVAGALVWMGVSVSSAGLAGAVAMASSPVIAMAVLNELRPRGQVSERLLMMTAVNTVCAVLALTAWRVLVTLDSDGFDWQPALAGALYALCGSYLLGAISGLLLERLSRQIHGPGLAALQLALVVLAAMLAAQFTVSPLLALLIAGMVARARMGHRLQVEPQLGSGGAALTLLLLVTLGLLSTLDGLFDLLPMVAAIIGARLLAKTGTVLLLARPSGLGWRQSLGLGLALQPASGLSVLLTSNTLGWPSSLPLPDSTLLQALLIALTLMQLSGPIWLQLGLGVVARETRDA
ncbi:cation:proton antiporter [Sphaerotilus sp.]|uniref:cation:proton antiporter n=1 Tax=Sphaerotilus sp. TaxID=2093942 RepID=UPI002ACD2C2B|nr:cation:proton antiporter [Sphaerotilus sp.]MDZ7854994.1 cation:proton antiporter [Sphaerotilus sp.]